MQYESDIYPREPEGYRYYESSRGGFHSMFEEMKRRFETVEQNTSRIFSNMNSLVESHIDLLNEEAKEQKERFVNGSILLAVAAVCLLGAFFAGSMALAHLLAESFELSLSAGYGLVTLLWLVIGPICLYSGLKALERFSIVPNSTLTSFKESIRCLRI